MCLAQNKKPSRPSRPPATPEEGAILCYSTLLATPAAAASWFYGATGLAGLIVLQMLLSVNYWRKPEWGARRNADCGTAVIISVLVANHWSVACQWGTAVRCMYFACFCIWCNAIRLWFSSPAWVWWHATFHLMMGTTGTVMAIGLAGRL